MMRGVNLTTDYEMKEMMMAGNYLRLSIAIDSDKHSDMSDSSPETTQYLINATKDQLLNNQEKMDALTALLKKAGLMPGSGVKGVINSQTDQPKPIV